MAERNSAICADSSCICCSRKVCSSAGEALVAGSVPAVLLLVECRADATTVAGAASGGMDASRCVANAPSEA